MNTTTQAVALNNEWLNTNTEVKLSASNMSETRTGDNIVNSTTTLGYTMWTNGVYCYPYLTYWPYAYAPKIQLKLSEIERLRKAAKDDLKLKEILNKFTPHIEVLVDF